jgi:hypothetical protein
MASTVPAREYHTRQIHYLRKRVTFADTGIDTGTTVKFRNALPANAFHIETYVDVEATFNAATTNVLTVGTNSGTANNIVAAGDVNEASAQMFVVAGLGVIDTSAPLDVYIKYTYTGANLTQGAATIVLAYAPAEE